MNDQLRDNWDILKYPQPFSNCLSLTSLSLCLSLPFLLFFYSPSSYSVFSIFLILSSFFLSSCQPLPPKKQKTVDRNCQIVKSFPQGEGEK